MTLHFCNSKKVFLPLLLVTILFGACTETVPPVVVSLDKDAATEMGLVANDKQLEVQVTNSTDQEATINWERSETATVTGWTYAVNGKAAASGTLKIPAQSTVKVMLVLNPNNQLGNGTGLLKFYDAADQSATMKTFSYDVTTLTEHFQVSAPGFTTQSVRVNDPDTDYLLSVINTNSCAITVTWEKTQEANIPSPWEVAICTDANCYDPEIIKKTMTIPPGDTVDFKATIAHYATTGNGNFTPIFYAPTDSINSVVTNYSITHEVTL